MKVNSRGRAALREAHGSQEAKIEDPERVRQSGLFDPFQGRIIRLEGFRGLRAKPLAHGY